MKVSEQRLQRTGYLTLRQAAAWLGMGATRGVARGLQRRLEELEREGRELLMRVGSGPRPRLYVTRAVLRDAFPEHWSERERVIGMLRGQFDELRTEDRRCRVERRVLGKRLTQLSQRVSCLERVGQ